MSIDFNKASGFGCQVSGSKEWFRIVKMNLIEKATDMSFFTVISKELNKRVGMISILPRNRNR